MGTIVKKKKKLTLSDLPYWYLLEAGPSKKFSIDGGNVIGNTSTSGTSGSSGSSGSGGSGGSSASSGSISEDNNCAGTSVKGKQAGKITRKNAKICAHLARDISALRRNMLEAAKWYAGKGVTRKQYAIDVKRSAASLMKLYRGNMETKNYRRGAQGWSDHYASAIKDDN